MKRIAVIFIVTVLIIAGTVSVAMYEVGDKILDEALEQAVLAEDITDQPSEPGTPETGSPGGKTPAKSSAAESEMPVPGKTSELSSEQSAGDNVNATEPAVSTGGSQTAKQKLEKIKANVSASDKMKISAMVFNRLSQSQISELTGMLAGGISSKEMQRAKKIAYENFTESEIKMIKSMYYKYANLVF